MPTNGRWQYGVLWRYTPDGPSWRGPLLGLGHRGFDTEQGAADYMETQIEPDRPDLEYKVTRRWVGNWEV